MPNQQIIDKTRETFIKVLRGESQSELIERIIEKTTDEDLMNMRDGLEDYVSVGKILEVLADMAEYDYSVRPLSKGPAQDARDLGPKLEPREPTPKGKSKKKKRNLDFMKSNPGYKDITE